MMSSESPQQRHLRLNAELQQIKHSEKSSPEKQ